MGTGVEEVDKYVSEVKSLLKNAREINLKGLDFARLYKRAKVLDKAISWLASYLTENEGDFSANKLMGQLYEEKGVLDKAVHFYRRSLELNNSQRDLVLKVADLYCQVPIHPERAWAWADRAARLHPGHPVVFKLKMHLLETAGKIVYDQMEDLLAEEMARRPDAELHIRLVKIYAARGCLLDAYTHCTAVVKTKAFADDLEWWACAMDIFERQLCQQLKLMPSSHGVTEANAHMLAAQARVIDLYLKQGNTQECLDALYRFDYSLSQAHKLKAPLRKELRRTTEWDVVLHEMLGQLYMSCAVFILRLAKENYLTWPRAVKLSCACFNVSAHIIEPDTKTAWVAKATKDKDPLRWYRMACTRLSTTGHFLLLLQSKEGTEWLESCLQDWSSQKGLHDILDTIYQRKKDLTKSFLAQDPSLFNSTLRIPSVDELVRYDEVRIDDQPRNLNQITWIGLNWLLYEGCMRPGVGVIVKRMFEKLPDDWIKIEDCSPRSLCHRDLEAFIYAVVRTSEERVLQDKESYHPDGQPKILPIQLCDSVVLPQQVAWWDAAISVYRVIRSYVDSGKVRHILHKGLEVLRVTCNHGMHLTLLVYLAENFAEKASFLQKAGAYPWSYEAHWMSLKARSGLYWKEVLKILERTETPPVVKDPLFPSLDTGEPKCVQAVWEKAHCALGEHAFREGRVEEAIELLEPVKSIRGMFHLAQVYCYLATVEIQGAASEDLDSEGCPNGPPEEYYIDLNHAKKLLENCLKQATSEAVGVARGCTGG